MFHKVIEESKIKALRHHLEHADQIVITCHMSPDGDALGASLGLARVLDNIGKRVHIITPDTPPKPLMFLPGAKDIVVFTRYEEFAEKLLHDADLIFALDYNDLKRIDRVGPALQASLAPVVMIDHHLYPTDFAEVVISHPEVSSTSMLIFRTLCRLELFPRIDKAAAECIYTGMMTDTGNFSYNSNDPDLYIAISELLRKGIDKDAIYARVHNCNTPSRLRLNGYALDSKMRIFDEYGIALITLTRDELNHYDYQRGDTEGLVNVPLTIEAVKASFFIREESGNIKISARSKGDFAVNTICEKYFGGGGHVNASGGEYHGTLEEAVAFFESILPDIATGTASSIN